jgi:hypothetical protein
MRGLGTCSSGFEHDQCEAEPREIIAACIAAQLAQLREDAGLLSGAEKHHCVARCLGRSAVSLI